MSAFLGMSEDAFIDRFTEIAPDRRGLVLASRDDGACVFLGRDNLCRVNAAKPRKCASFPFEWRNPDSESVCPALAEAACGARRTGALTEKEIAEK